MVGDHVRWRWQGRRVLEDHSRGLRKSDCEEGIAPNPQGHERVAGAPDPCSPGEENPAWAGVAEIEAESRRASVGAVAAAGLGWPFPASLSGIDRIPLSWGCSSRKNFWHV